MNDLPDWLNDLMDEYPTNRSDDAISRLGRVFADVPAGIMQSAVDAYMRDGNKFFPKVGDLSPYVTKLQEWQPQEWAAEQWHEWNMLQLRRQIKHSDEQMAAWEVARGTMTADALPVAEMIPAADRSNP